MTISLTRVEMAEFYSREYSDILENGLTTAYGNYLSGNFFKTFFKGLTLKRGYYLKAHLLSYPQFRNLPNLIKYSKFIVYGNTGNKGQKLRWKTS
jgi:hypothetical protein